jgi:hypothetical protein
MGRFLVRRAELEEGPRPAARLPQERGYRKNKVGRPVHGPEIYSHGADPFCTFATSFHQVGGYSALRGGFGTRAVAPRIWGII